MVTLLELQIKYYFLYSYSYSNYSLHGYSILTTILRLTMLCYPRLFSFSVIISWIHFLVTLHGYKYSFVISYLLVCRLTFSFSLFHFYFVDVINLRTLYCAYYLRLHFTVTRSWLLYHCYYCTITYLGYYVKVTV